MYADTLWQSAVVQSISYVNLISVLCSTIHTMSHTLQYVTAVFIACHFFFLHLSPQTSDLSVVFKESTPSTPLIFVLSPGTDPAADLYKFADVMQFSKKMRAISLGQGQVRAWGIPGNSLTLSLPLSHTHSF